MICNLCRPWKYIFSDKLTDRDFVLLQTMHIYKWPSSSLEAAVFHCRWKSSEITNYVLRQFAAYVHWPISKGIHWLLPTNFEMLRSYTPAQFVSRNHAARQYKRTLHSPCVSQSLPWTIAADLRSHFKNLYMRLVNKSMIWSSAVKTDAFFLTFCFPECFSLPIPVFDACISPSSSRSFPLKTTLRRASKVVFQRLRICHLSMWLMHPLLHLSNHGWTVGIFRLLLLLLAAPKGAWCFFAQMLWRKFDFSFRCLAICVLHHISFPCFPIFSQLGELYFNIWKFKDFEIRSRKSDAAQGIEKI